MSRGPDAATLLRRMLDRSARDADVRLAITSADWQRWASATFAGARHRLTVEADDNGAARAWFAAVNDVDLPVRGHLVADILVTALTHESGRLIGSLEVLTVEDC